MYEPTWVDVVLMVVMMLFGVTLTAYILSQDDDEDIDCGFENCPAHKGRRS